MVPVSYTHLAVYKRQIFGSESPLGKTLNYSIGGTTVPMLVKGVYADVPLNTEDVYKRQHQSFRTSPDGGRYTETNEYQSSCQTLPATDVYKRQGLYRSFSS